MAAAAAGRSGRSGLRRSTLNPEDPFLWESTTVEQKQQIIDEKIHERNDICDKYDREISRLRREIGQRVPSFTNYSSAHLTPHTIDDTTEVQMQKEYRQRNPRIGGGRRTRRKSQSRKKLSKRRTKRRKKSRKRVKRRKSKRRN